MADIWDSIWKAKVVIADVTQKNPNVNYELGLCHALGVPTVIITQNRKHVPFDYTFHRHILYEPKKSGWMHRLKMDLINHIEGVLESTTARDRMLLWPEGAKVAHRVSKSATLRPHRKRSAVLDSPRVPFKHKQDADFIKELILRESKGFRLKITVPQETYWRCGFVLAPKDYIHEGRTDISLTEYFLFHIGQGGSVNPRQSTSLNFQVYYRGHSAGPQSFLSKSPVEVVVRFNSSRRRVSITFGDQHYDRDLDPRYLRQLYILAWADWFGPFRVPVELTML